MIETESSKDGAELLRSRGLRSTPQRRAVLAAFRGGQTEHLSADEVHARANQALPDLGRGTVYAALAEFTELGLLGAVGAPEPVRYETNTSAHDHFRCRLCLRIFDLDGATHDLGSFAAGGFVIERVEVQAEGVCADCKSYEAGLAKGGRAILSRSSVTPALGRRGVAAAELSSPLGPLLLAAGSDGLFRLAFEDHADVAELRALISSRRGGEAARRHLAQTCEGLDRYFEGDGAQVEAAVDWAALPNDWVDALRATREIHAGATRSYADFLGVLPARRLGEAFGANPIPIVTPCHRVSRGVEIPDLFVGGAERRAWLLAHERGPGSGPRPAP